MAFNTDTITQYATQYGMNILMALAIFIIGKWLAKFAMVIIKKAMVRSKLDETLISFSSNIIYGLMIAFITIAALSKLGINTSSLAAIMAAAGLAIGLSLQGSLSNFASGVMIIIFRPFKIGDFIEAGGASGVVEGMSIFTTTLNTTDNKTVIVPNNAMTSGNITNYSTQPTRRVDMVFGCGYGDDLKKAKEVLNAIIAADDRVLAEPAPTVAVMELGDNSVNFTVRPWVKAADYWGVYFDTHENVKLEFDKNEISIPFPQQDVHMHTVEK
jgi:small conductance mechanosensitive channel